MKVDNAVIMAAGTSSRFAPLSYEKPKALIEARGEVLIERQIKQLKEAGIREIILVTGYKKDQFNYLKDKYGIKTLFNSEYSIRNNNSSIWTAKDYLGNSYVCSADNYFSINPFEREVEDSYYAAEYSEGETSEWCMTENPEGFVDTVEIGGRDAWYMMGHTFWSCDFSNKFLQILAAEYNKQDTAGKLWEKIYIEHLDILKMRIRKYDPDVIYEFDTLDELRKFDESYVINTRSSLIKRIAEELRLSEKDMNGFKCIDGDDAEAVGFEFLCPSGHYRYYYDKDQLETVNN